MLLKYGEILCKEFKYCSGFSFIYKWGIVRKKYSEKGKKQRIGHHRLSFLSKFILKSDEKKEQGLEMAKVLRDQHVFFSSYIQQQKGWAAWAHVSEFESTTQNGPESLGSQSTWTLTMACQPI